MKKKCYLAFWIGLILLNGLVWGFYLGQKYTMYQYSRILPFCNVEIE
jgi:uncharacterized protein YneF (UPF0154 family)